MTARLLNAMCVPQLMGIALRLRPRYVHKVQKYLLNKNP